MTNTTPTPAPTPAEAAPPGLSVALLEELDAILDDLRTREEETPQWEFCDGFLTALVCMRRPVPLAESLPMLLGDGTALEDVHEHHRLPLLPAFAHSAQQARFIELWQRRWDEVAWQLAQDPEQVPEGESFYPEVMDTRGLLAELPEAERAALGDEPVPSFAQVWALGFMFAVENWPEDWAPPRDKETAGWIDGALECIVALTEDDTGQPSVRMLDGDGPPSTSQARVDAFSDALWACYDLYQIWHNLGPRIETFVKAPTPGRNDPCSCGSGKKYKKCCGA